MSVWKIENLVDATAGILSHRGTCTLDGVGTDTRSNLNNKIFFALKGENFDAHDYVEVAIQNGASAVIVDRHISVSVGADVHVVVVEDVLKALQKFASWHRKQWHGKMIGLTGSNGKTTTKEFIYTILSMKHLTACTQGNLNNHIGVPLTLLDLREEHKFSVVEMGMSHAHEIEELVQMSLPDVVLVTNVGTAHIESFGTIDKIANAKEEIYEFALPHATRIYNLDDEYTAMMRARAPGGCKILTYSSHTRDVNVSLKEKFFTFDYLEVQGVIGEDPGQARVPVFGRHQISNCMAAAAVGLAFNIDAPTIWKGLTKFHGSWGRGQIVELTGGAKVLFDAYNANPDSTKVALDNFSRLKILGKKYLVLGDMLELGIDSPQLHFEIGREASKLNPDGVLLIGQFANDIGRGMQDAGYKKTTVISKTYEEKLAAQMGNMLETGDVVLVKGSRGMKLERAVQLWSPLNF